MSDEQNDIIAALDALPMQELAEISKEHFDPEGDANRVPSFEGRFTIIKVKNDSQAFEMEGQLLKEVRGVIVEFHLTKTWFEESYEKSGGGNRPDCYSNDSVTPLADSPKKQAEKCSTCPRNQFEPNPLKPGKKKKDCRDTITLYLWNPRIDKPLLLRVSTMNRIRVSDFIKALADKGVAKEMLTCEFTLFEDKETADLPFSGLTIKPIGTVLQMVKLFQDPKNKEMALQWFAEEDLAKLTPKDVVECILEFKQTNAELFNSEGAVAGAMADTVKPQVEEKKLPVNQPTQQPKAQTQQAQQPKASGGTGGGSTTTPITQKPPVKEATIDYDEEGDGEPPF